MDSSFQAQATALLLIPQRHLYEDSDIPARWREQMFQFPTPLQLQSPRRQVAHQSQAVGRLWARKQVGVEVAVPGACDAFDEGLVVEGQPEAVAVEDHSATILQRRIDCFHKRKGSEVKERLSRTRGGWREERD
jgi:hypothetical protein